MLKGRPPILDEVIGSKEIILSVILKYIANESSETIFINESGSFEFPLYTTEKMPSNKWVSLEEFFPSAIKRWEEELIYQEEIIVLKDQIYEEFNAICTKENTQKSITLWEDHCARIVDEIFNLIQFDKKQVVNEFFNNITNGFENEIPRAFPYVAITVLHSTLLKPYPIGLIDFIRKTYLEYDGYQKKLEIKDFCDKIMVFIQNYLHVAPIFLKNFKSMPMLENHLKKLVNERKICSLWVEEVTLDLTLIGDYKKTCIEFVQFFNDKVWCITSFSPFDAIEINSQISDGASAKKLLESLNFRVKNIKLEFHELPTEIIYLIPSTLSKLAMLTHLELNLIRNNIGNQEIAAFAGLFEKICYLNRLKLNLSWNRIESLGFISFSEGLAKLKSLKCLDLSIGQNKINDDGFIYFTSCLSQLVHLRNLYLILSSNQIQKEGILNFVEMISKMSKISHLMANFAENKIEDKGLTTISEILKHLKFLVRIDLNFRGNPTKILGRQIIEDLRKELKQMNIQHMLSIQKLQIFLILLEGHGTVKFDQQWKNPEDKINKMVISLM